ncbi:acetyl-CoA hydrolase/transferase family protein [Clostridium sp. CS001]|uniref:acetyl-CoA hydrolase/transferase family protein n=1 Tax=Clostridium sp. CS001 TaxID=2880648 RepID=UPI001CF2923C|nr:acetyl-CoA hydrolase/transferase family protein [Clostridium sp. CS001]MCB2291748.1 acetyl-CoA hydrolase/transferase family protein [Clostridium sp. CS001]
MNSERIRNESLKGKIMSAEEAAKLIKHEMVVGVSGFTPSGYPKAVPLALANRVKATGEKMKLTLYTGASVGAEIDGAWAEAGIISKRLPYQTNNEVRDSINNGDINYIDMHLSHSTQYVDCGAIDKVNVAIIEAVAITEEGCIIPSTAIGNAACYIKNADFVIVEVNESQPIQLEGMADIYMTEKPPFRKPIPLMHPGDRIGTTCIPCGVEKIAAIVMTNLLDKTRPLAPINEASRKISKNLIEFLEKEVEKGRLPEDLLPLQSGVGSVANAVLGGLCESKFKNLTCYTEVIQDSMLDLLKCGKAVMASSTAISLSPERMVKFKEEIDFFKDKIVLRPQEISNNPEISRRIGVIAMNTAIEVDIYGNVNSTHIMGSKMMNGIGGSGDFARNAYLTIFTTESIAKNGDISSIVPMVSHVDHTEHDVMVIVTEQGVADLRGLCPRERALEIINNCAHPEYKSELMRYFEDAQRSGAKHTPHMLEKSLGWHSRFLATGSMKVKEPIKLNTKLDDSYRNIS